MPDIYLYSPEAKPGDIELRDPYTLDVEGVVGTGAVRFAVSALDGSGTVVGVVTGTGAIAFKVPDLFSTYPVLLEVDSPHRYPSPRRHAPTPPPPRIPVHAHLKPTVEPLPIPEPISEPLVASDNRAAVVALYAAGEIDELQLAALLAA